MGGIKWVSLLLSLHAHDKPGYSMVPNFSFPRMHTRMIASSNCFSNKKKSEGGENTLVCPG